MCEILGGRAYQIRIYGYLMVKASLNLNLKSQPQSIHSEQDGIKCQNRRADSEIEGIRVIYISRSIFPMLPAADHIARL
jgi:hypothetical protein